MPQNKIKKEIKVKKYYDKKVDDLINSDKNKNKDNNLYYSGKAFFRKDFITSEDNELDIKDKTDLKVSEFNLNENNDSNKNSKEINKLETLKVKNINVHKISKIFCLICDIKPIKKINPKNGELMLNYVEVVNLLYN